MKKFLILLLSLIMALCMIAFVSCDTSSSDRDDDDDDEDDTKKTPSIFITKGDEEDDGDPSDTKVNPWHKHDSTLLYHEPKGAECDVSGNIEYWECESCGTFFSDEKGKNEISDKESVIIKAPGHHTEIVFDSEGHWREAICEHKDYKTEKEAHTFKDEICTVCNYISSTAGLLYGINSDGTGYILKGIGTATATDVSIASTYEGLPVVEIAYRAFKDCKNLTSVNIPETVTVIGEEAFYGCEQLSVINIPSSVTKIYSGAFRGSGIKTLTIPKNVTSIGKGITAYCNELESITVASGNKNYTSMNNCIINGKYLVAGCKNSTAPSGVARIEEKAFYGITELKSFNFTSSITHIGSYAFMVTGLTSLDLSSTSIQSINSSVFDSCADLKTVKLPSSLTQINHFAFAHCTSLEEITIPSRVTLVGFCTFSGCKSLKSVNFENTKGWECMGSSISVSNPSTNAKKLIDDSTNGSNWTRE